VKLDVGPGEGAVVKLCGDGVTCMSNDLIGAKRCFCTYQVTHELPGSEVGTREGAGVSPGARAGVGAGLKLYLLGRLKTNKDKCRHACISACVERRTSSCSCSCSSSRPLGRGEA
jgi:hypothetical protein